MDILGIIVGLIFVYLIMSLICTAVREVLSSFLKERAKNLETRIGELITSGIATEFYSDPVIKALYEKTAKPSYIPATIFAQVVYKLAGGIAGGSLSADVRAALQNGPLASTLVPLFDAADGELTTFLKNVEGWYDASMDRLAAWYKRKSQWILLAIAAAVAIVVNVDTLQITRALATDAALRRTVVAQAELIARQDKEPVIEKEEIRAKIAELQKLGLPLGWPTKDYEWLPASAWPRKAIGLLLSALAMSLGAPFWFDLLKKFISIRSSGENPAEK